MLRQFNFKKKDGVTLIELVVTLAIATVAAGAIILILVSGINVFNSGSSQYDVQGSARMAAEYVTEEIKYAVDIEIVGMDDIESDIPIYVNYLYYDGLTGEIVKLSKFDVETKWIGLEGILKFWVEPYEDEDEDGIEDNLDNNKLLRYIVTAQDDTRTYNIENKVNSLNLDLGDSSVITYPDSYDPSTGGTVVRYTSISDFISKSQLPVVEIGDVNNAQEIELNCNKIIASAIVTDHGTNQLDREAQISIPDSNTVILTFTQDVQNNRELEIAIDFYESDGVPSKYVYTLNFSNTDLWTVTGITG